MRQLLGIDAGTTALKAVLYEESGRQIASATCEYALETSNNNFVETDPRVYWNSLHSALHQIFSKTGPSGRRVHALAISSQGESFIAIDRQGNPLRKTIVWLDSRSDKQASVIDKQFGARKVYRTTGSPDVNPTWASTKLLWLRDNQKNIFDQIHKILFVEDYLIYRLTGRFAANGALYCSSLLYDIHRNTWWDEMLDFLHLRQDQLPALYPSGHAVAGVNPKIAEELGFDGAPLVVTGGMDQACSCIGTANIASGIVTENTGSSLNISVTSDRPVFDPKHRVPLQTHAIPGKFIYLPWCTTAGMVLRWFRDNFCQDLLQNARQSGKDPYDLLTENLDSIPPGSDGVTILPHWSGAMSPEMDPDARGVICGLSLSTTRDHITRAILEAVAYMSRANLDLVEEAGIHINKILLAGGASRSSLWNQIKADVLGKPVRTLQNPESGCLGAAILAGAGAGVYPSIQSACEKIILEDREFAPHPDARRVYQTGYALYKELYQNLKPLFPKMKTLRE